MVLAILLFILLLVPLLWVTARGEDAWPFSHYPMFSRLTDLEGVEVFRVALETTSGEIVWWRSEFYRYPEYVGRRLKRIHQRGCEGGKAAALALVERQRCLAEVRRLIESEAGLEHYQALHIVRRTVDKENGFAVEDHPVARIPLAQIKRFQ